MKKLLLGMCLFIFAVSCSKKDSNDSNDSNSNTTDVYIKVTIEGKEVKFEGKRQPNEKGCAILSDNHGGFRMAGYDGVQYINFWIDKVPLTSITTTNYTYAQSSPIDWNLNGYNVSTENEMMAGALILTFNKIESGKHSGTFSGTVTIKPGGISKTIPVTGEFNNVEIVQ